MKSILLPTLILFVFQVTAQENFQPGMIVTLSGDTLKGQIDNQLWSFNPTAVRFSSGAGGITTYKPQEIRGFMLKDAHYRSYRVKYDSSSKKVQHVSSIQIPTYKEQDLFLKVLLVSRYSLMELLDEGDRVHYFIGDSDKVEELVNHPFKIERNGTMLGMAENRLFIKQLRQYVASCSTISVEEKMPYKRKNLEAIIKLYAECSGYKGSSQLTVDKAKTRVAFGVTGNVAYDKFTKEATAGMGYGMGIFLSFSPPNRFYKTTYRFEVTNHNFPGFSTTFAPGLYRTVSISSLKFSAMARIRFEESAHQSFFVFGVSRMSNQITYGGTYYEFIAEPNIALMGGMGTNFGRLSTEIRAEFGAAGYLSLQAVMSFTLLRTRTK